MCNNGVLDKDTERGRNNYCYFIIIITTIITSDKMSII